MTIVENAALTALSRFRRALVNAERHCRASTPLLEQAATIISSVEDAHLPAHNVASARDLYERAMRLPVGTS